MHTLFVFVCEHFSLGAHDLELLLQMKCAMSLPEDGEMEYNCKYDGYNL